jgi:hypothetical protein
MGEYSISFQELLLLVEQSRAREHLKEDEVRIADEDAHKEYTRLCRLNFEDSPRFD